MWEQYIGAARVCGASGVKMGYSTLISSTQPPPTRAGHQYFLIISCSAPNPIYPAIHSITRVPCGDSIATQRFHRQGDRVL